MKHSKSIYILSNLFLQVRELPVVGIIHAWNNVSDEIK